MSASDVSGTDAPPEVGVDVGGTFTDFVVATDPTRMRKRSLQRRSTFYRESWA
ncbi:hypothetical protein GGP99_002863 [Salinibacter ruber]|jgi:hypothetical protein|uniref:Hydantoinase/oxoprolinase N-terminal domain-containing protein n=1 Tax=Salinibacter ruber TaxID=146919 RepID=A0AAW5PC42_9BACT|nr:hypothetical protein [Salinibacter ruber]MCS4222877.1 hypothetical protein [Salinibacter ruber]